MTFEAFVHALRVLEFGKIVDRLRVRCETPLAADWADDLTPSFSYEAVWADLGLTQEAYESLGRSSPPALGAVRDPRNSLKLAEKGASLGGKELFQIGESMATMRSLKGFLAARIEELPRLSQFRDSLPDQKKIEEKLLEGLEPDGTVKDQASPALQSLRQKKKATQQRIQDRIQSFISGRSRDLLSDPIFTMRDGRYVLPVKAENRGKIRGIVHDSSASGQTIYVEPEEVLQLGNALREIEAAEREEIQRILLSWSLQVGAVAGELIGGVEAASSVDLIFAKARLGYDMKATFPVKSRAPHRIQIHGGRHPGIESEKVVPVDISIGKDANVLITGPNTGGKTVAIKCVGLFVCMAQSGLMLPALNVEFSPFTQLWADIGDEQSLEQSLSTFSGHLKNIADALKRLKSGALVLLDEVGSGTDPAEGAALARAILAAFAERGAAILASTHYGELKAFAFSQEGFANAAMEFDAKTLRPTYKLLMGAPGASQALRIAERYGIASDIVENARILMGEQAQDVAEMLAQLETAQRLARNAQAEADRRLNELRKAETKAQRKLQEAEEIRKTVHGKANEVIEAALREIRLEASRIFEEVKLRGADPKVVDRARKGLGELDAVGRDFAQEFVPKRSGPLPDVSKGSYVKVDGFTQSGTVLSDPKDGSVVVQMGSLKMTLPLNRMILDLSKTPTTTKPTSSIRLQRAINATTEIDLRHLRSEEAMNDLERFIDNAVLAGLDSVRVIHGKGEGILRKATQDLLKSHPSVGKYRDGEPAEGGQGATVASLT